MGAAEAGGGAATLVADFTAWMRTVNRTYAPAGIHFTVNPTTRTFDMDNVNGSNLVGPSDRCFATGDAARDALNLLAASFRQSFPGHIVVTDDLTMTLNWNHLAPVERAEKFAGGWDGEWFKEDYCEGPGQALIVTPKGEVKPCCGFASDLDQLIEEIWGYDFGGNERTLDVHINRLRERDRKSVV